jgi:hypothetical protein
MNYGFTSSPLVAVILLLVGAIAHSQGRAVYEPSASDPRIIAALDAQKRLEGAMQRLDFPSIEALFAPDLVVHSPINMVVDRTNVLARIRGGQISYEPNVERNIDFAGVRGDTVVIMGEEIVRPIANTPNAGKVVHRRFSDIWKNTDGVWRLAVRQATVTSAE